MQVEGSIPDLAMSLEGNIAKVKIDFELFVLKLVRIKHYYFCTNLFNLTINIYNS